MSKNGEVWTKETVDECADVPPAVRAYIHMGVATDERLEAISQAGGDRAAGGGLEIQVRKEKEGYTLMEAEGFGEFCQSSKTHHFPDLDTLAEHCALQILSMKSIQSDLASDLLEHASEMAGVGDDQAYQSAVARLL